MSLSRWIFDADSKKDFTSTLAHQVLRFFGFYNFDSTFVVKHLKSEYSGTLHCDVTE